MAGLLDWLQTPSGIGLLSAVAGGMAGARRGQPVNNVGRGLSAGVTGYSAANDQIKQDADNKQAQQLKQMQMEQLQQSMNQQKELQTWKAGLPRIMAPTVTGTTDQGSQLADQQAAFGQEGMQGLTESAQYADAPLNVYSGPDRRAVQEYMAQPGSPYIDEVMKQQLPKAPKWNVTERYNAQTGMPEKVLMDENNPTDVRPFGGAQADTIVADNTGGSLVYRGSRSANPISEVQRTATPGEMMTDRRTRDEGAANRGVTMRGQNMTDARAGSATGKTGGPMSVTLQKELLESDDGVQSSRNVVNTLNQALEINKEGYSGYLAKPRAYLRSNLPGESKSADATVALDNMMTGQALESLKSTFGAMPTEGERKILLEMQASSDKTPKQREDIINRAIVAAQRREKYAAAKAKSIRDGSYLTQGAPVIADTVAKPKTVNQLPTKPPAGVDANIWQHMTPAERKLWQK